MLCFALFLSLAGCGSDGGGYLVEGSPGPGPGPTTNPPVTGPGFLLENWQWARPLPSGNSLYGIAHANEDYIAVGYSGTIYTSSNGLVDSGTMRGLSSVAYGNGTYMAVGAGGTILTSSTGTNWMLHDPIDSAAYSYSGVAFGKNTFVAVSYGDVCTSQDNGVTWTKQHLFDPTSTWFIDVYFENNQFIATTDSEKIFTSPDGLIWTERLLPDWSFSFNAFCFGQDKYVASNPDGAVYTSTDAVTWTAASYIGEDIYGMAYGDGLFVAVGGQQGEWGSIYTSTDAVTWTKQEEKFLAHLSRVIFTGTKFAAIGGDGMIVESDDGLNWTEVSVRLTKRGLNSIAYGNGLLIAPMTYYSEHALYLSADGGVSWTTLPALPGDAPVNRIKFMDGLFYAFCGPTIYTSPDGYNWTTFYSSTVPYPYSYFYDLIHSNNLYVLVGTRPGLLTSTDGLTWIERWTGYSLMSVTFGNNSFVAVGASGRVISSEDGLTWSDANIYVWPNDYFVSVAYGNNQFVAVGHYGSIYSSSDGEKWDSRVYGGEYSGKGYLSQVIYTQDGFVAVGWDGLYYTSLDGIDWTKAISPGGSTGVAYGSNSYYVSGWPGSILKSDRVTFYPDLPIM